jgi:hypothetical protein
MSGKKKTYYASPIDRRGEREVKPDPREVARLKAAIPQDTRSTTGRVFGDPLPGRRAIDRRRAGGPPRAGAVTRPALFAGAGLKRRAEF